jgi:acyl carrier protein
MESKPAEGSENHQPHSLFSSAINIEEQKLPALVESNKVEISQEENEIKSQVLGVVSEKTGYPVEMLDLDLDLEADLGIDTVKQAELIATIRDHYGIPLPEDLILAEYNTWQK